MANESPARITRVVLKNYKSIVHCDVELKPLTILVGPNGSGKSNFVDALRFVQEALTVGLEQAIRNRGNALHILSEGRATGESSFSITLYFDLKSGRSGQYSFTIKIANDGEYLVEREELVSMGVSVFSVTEDNRLTLTFQVPGAEVSETRRHTLGAMPSWPRGRLLLASYSEHPDVPRVHRMLTSMAFYDPDPEAMRVIRLRESSQRLLPDAANIASMLYLASRTNPQFMELIRDHLVRTLPGLQEIRAENLGGYDLMSLRQDVENAQGSWKAQPDQISDGTLRALAVLVALFQGRIDKQSATSLVGIEEPETGLHPAAADVLFNALVDASHTTQVLVTTHSTALLDSDDVDVESLLAVVSENGSTVIGPIDDVGRSILRDHLFTVGELLQMEQLRPEAPSESPTDAPGAPMPVGPTR